MVKFGDFESVDLNTFLSLPILSYAASVREGSTREDKDPIDESCDSPQVMKNEFAQKVNKATLRENMVRRPKIKTLSLHSKKKEIKAHYFQERLRPITFEKYLPYWFYTKFTCYGTKPLCCNVDEKEVKGVTL